MTVDEWFPRITKPWPAEKTDWEKSNWDEIVSWESNWDWEKGVRRTNFKLKNKDHKTFTSEF